MDQKYNIGDTVRCVLGCYINKSIYRSTETFTVSLDNCKDLNLLPLNFIKLNTYFNIGDEVWVFASWHKDLTYTLISQGIVNSIGIDLDYPISVRLHATLQDIPRFTIDGKRKLDGPVCLSHTPPKIVGNSVTNINNKKRL